MADSLANILAHKSFDEPPEIQIIKQYVREQFQEEVEVIVRERDILIVSPGAALANTLRLRGPVLKKLCDTKKRLVFRIGQQPLDF